ncbi:hypothetical protein FOCC_FOCC013050 [Frankliniella occidentalis]|nr:hypothetical protein FOCC_FOCC013050 [Frankliniella occidentalis]
MRQNEVNFQKALKHLARGTLTENDIRLLKSRTFRQLPQDRSLKNAIHLFARNVDVDSYNQEAIKKIDNPQYICTASDVLEGHGSELAKRQLLYSTANSKIQDTVGMPSIVQFKVKARYMITYNIDTEDGLCNGATGKLKKIDFGQNEKHEKKPLRVWIKFDEQHVGTQARHKHKDIMKARKIPQSWTPIYPIVVKIKTRKNCSLKVNRMQFALTLAHAITIHKSQGQTMKQVVVHLSNRMTKQLLYVACSRATTIDGLYIIGNFIPTKPLQENDHMSLEMTRWKTNSIIPVFSNIKSSDMYIAMYHNVQSLPKHQKLIINDKNFTASGLLFFGEIWMSSHDQIDIPHFKLLHKIDSGHARKPSGVCVYVNNNICNLVSASGCFTIKHTNNKIETTWVKIRNCTYCGLYAKPGTSIETWKTWLAKILQTCSGNLLIMGDFNIDALKSKSPLQKHLSNRNLTILNRKEHTTHNKTCLDWIVSNYKPQHGHYASYFSYHQPIWTKMACFNNTIVNITCKDLICY